MMSGSSFSRNALLASALALTGCYSRITGHDGKFELAYASFVQTENFVKPIAPGAKLDLLAFEHGSDENLEIVKATSTKPDVLTIDRIEHSKVTLKAIAEGAADIEVTAKDATGKTVVDRMFFHVRKPSTHKIQHACAEGRTAAYVKGSFVDIGHDLATSDKRPVIGYDYVPVKAEPASVIDFESQPPAFSFYRYKAKMKGEATLRSMIDDSSVQIRVIERGELRDATLYADPRLIAGRESYAMVEVTFGDTPLCSQDALTKAKSLTPDICEVTARLDEDPDSPDSNRVQFAKIAAKAFGTCRYEVSLPELDGGKGVVLKGELQVGRVEWPSDKRFLGLDIASWTGLSKWYVISRLAVLGGLVFWRRRQSFATFKAPRRM